jgi:sporulation protein YpjB
VRLIHRFSVLLLVTVVWASFILLSACSKEQSDEEQTDELRERQQTKLIQLNKVADSFYKKVNAGSMEEARNELNEIGVIVTQIEFDGIASVEGVEALTETIVSGKGVFNAVRLKEDEALIVAAKIRLLSDALTHPHHPMWLQYHKVLSEDIRSLEQSVKQEKVDDAKHAVRSLEHHYSIVRPSLMISRDAVGVKKMDSMLAFIQKEMAQGSIEYARIESVFNPLLLVLDELFMKKHQQAYAPFTDGNRPMIWSMGIGTAIVVVLAYVAWRKYKYDKGYLPVRKPESVDGTR